MDPLVISVDEAMAYRRAAEKVLATGDLADRKKLIRTCVSEIRLAPEDLTVEIQYKLPEPVVNALVALNMPTGAWM